MKLRIFHYGEDVLRQTAEPISCIDDELRTLVKNMFETMQDAKGVGLAAPQVGVSKRLFVIDLENQPLVFINPKIIKASGKEISDEGCLSFPGLRENVQRATLVIATATDLEGKEFKVTAEGLMARAIQHEYDHVEGVLIVDRISKARKMQIRKELEAIQAGERLDQEDDEEETKEL